MGVRSTRRDALQLRRVRRRVQAHGQYGGEDVTLACSMTKDENLSEAGLQFVLSFLAMRARTVISAFYADDIRARRPVGSGCED